MPNRNDDHILAVSLFIGAMAVAALVVYVAGYAGVV